MSTTGTFVKYAHAVWFRIHLLAAWVAAVVVDGMGWIIIATTKVELCSHT